MSSNKKKRSGKGTTFLLILIFVIGLSLLLYPTFANYYNAHYTTRIVGSYSEAIAEIEEKDYHEIWEAADAYNRDLLLRGFGKPLDEEWLERYSNCLLVSGTRQMIGYIEIPKLNLTLSISHGTGDDVLASGVGHLNWTNLPGSGLGTHCALSGHRGLPSARLFTDLDDMVEGDIFILRILNEVFTYEVDQIRIVEPDNLADLYPDPELELCTLITCTPYGVNTHRMLVRGHRIENLQESETIRVTADAIQIDTLIVAVALAIPILLLLIIYVLIFGGNQGQKQEKRNQVKEKVLQGEYKKTRKHGRLKS